jgi:hypothetical protein
MKQAVDPSNFLVFVANLGDGGPEGRVECKLPWREEFSWDIKYSGGPLISFSKARYP